VSAEVPVDRLPVHRPGTPERILAADGQDGEAGTTAAGAVNREDWGLTWNMPLDGGRRLVSKEIRIEIELEAVLER
jgi:polyisoprenoid-binding protein YceI